jgi:hypothetical protein
MYDGNLWMRLYAPKSDALTGKMESTVGCEGPGAIRSNASVISRRRNSNTRLLKPWAISHALNKKANEVT